MHLHIKQNLAEDVISILNIVKRHRCEIAANRTPFDASSAFEDLETHLCDLLSSMISSPLTGRLFLSPPQAYVSEEARQSSLQHSVSGTEH